MFLYAVTVHPTIFSFKDGEPMTKKNPRATRCFEDQPGHRDNLYKIFSYFHPRL